MSSASEDRLKRLRVRSWRRGTREMDLILGPFADAALGGLDDGSLAAYDQLLSESDQDLYQWISGRSSMPARHEEIVARIRAHYRLG